jgi:hypothetical protein
VLPAAIIDASVREALLSGLGALTGIGVVYVIVGFGLIEIGMWALGRLWTQLTYLVGLVARTLPILLIIVVFLLFEPAIWQVAHAMDWTELWTVLLLLLLLAGLFVATAFQRELRPILSEPTREQLIHDAGETPAKELADAGIGDPVPVPRLTWLQGANLTLLAVVPTLLQATFVAAVVAFFLAAFATYIIPPEVLSGWLGEPASVIVAIELLGEARVATAEMAVVCALLGGLVGLYFSGLAISDPAYRSERFERDVAGVRSLLAARALYLGALRRGTAAT